MPRAGLSPLRVTEEAEALADEVGFDSLTLAAVAVRLDVRLPSLYKHVDGLDALRRTMASRARAELSEVLRTATAGTTGCDAVRALARCYRSWAGDHPGRYAASLRAPAQDDTIGVAEAAATVQVVADALAGFGLEGDDMIDAIRTLRALLHGFLALEAAGGFGLPVAVGASFDVAVDAFIRSLSSWSEAPR